MLELGEDTSKEHSAILDLLKEKKFMNVILVGSNFCSLKNKANANCFETVEQAVEHIKLNPLQQSSILIKGSRGIRLEKALEVL